MWCGGGGVGVKWGGVRRGLGARMTIVIKKNNKTKWSEEWDIHGPTFEFWEKHTEYTWEKNAYDNEKLKNVRTESMDHKLLKSWHKFMTKNTKQQSLLCLENYSTFRYIATYLGTIVCLRKCCNAFVTDSIPDLKEIVTVLI